ncbi:MAG: hypothetical protein ACP5RQ_00560 [Candidatus Micrarchaeia archaeon]
MAQAIQIKKKHHINKFTKVILLLFIIFAVFLIGFTVYFATLLKNANITPIQPIPKYIAFNAKVVSEDILYYNYGRFFVPYALFNYTASNITSINISARILPEKPPSNIYILNWSGYCYNCGNLSDFKNNLNSSLSLLGVTNSTNPVKIINENMLDSLNNQDILIIANGRMPQYLFNNTIEGIPLIQQILNNGVTVIYIGKSFSKTLTYPSLLIPAQNIPSFLSTSQNTSNQNIGPYPNQNLSFSLTNGKYLNYMSYISVGNGYFFVFPDYLNSFPNTSAASSFFAPFIKDAMWIPNIDAAYYSVPINYTPKTSGSFGLLFNVSNLLANNATINKINSGYIITTIIVHSIYNINFTTTYINKLSVSTNGSISLPFYSSPGVPINSSITLFINHSTFVEPHISVYTLNMKQVSSVAPVFAKNLSSTFTYYENFTPTVSKGYYIIEVNGYEGQHYASALTSVPPIFISLVLGNYTGGKFLFTAFSGGKPVSNINAIVTLDNNYSENVIINNGYFIYTLPPGASIPQGNVTFKVSTLSQVAVFKSYYKPVFVAINQQYIEFIIVLIIVILEVTLIRTPFRDEFYIDVPNLPPPKRAEIKIRDTELLNVFNSLNNYYHWHYMPLSEEEFKVGVANNIRFNSIPVNLTYENIELILDTLAEKGYIVSADNLYAPTSWIEQSKHDIEYLATFKKLRYYLVGHGHIFTDLDKSDVADIITSLHNEKVYLVIYSKTSRFIKKLPIQEGIKTYLVFLNDDKLNEFMQTLYTSISSEAEILKMYISLKKIVLISADNPEEILS